MEPGSEELNVNSGRLSFVGPSGPESTVVSGAVTSTTKVRVVAGASVFSAGSVARTWNVCWPSLRSAAGS